MSGVGTVPSRVVLPVKKACPDSAVDVYAACCDGRTLFRAQSHSRAHLDDGQISHARDAQIARRANLPHVFVLAASGKSERSSRASRLDEEGRTRGRHDT